MMTEVFSANAREIFRKNYPETPHMMKHGLAASDLLTLEALAELGTALPGNKVEYNRANLPLGVDPDADIANGLSIGDTIRTVEENGSWAVLKNIEQVPEYRKLLMGLLGELKPDIEAMTGEMLTPEGFIFVSSPNAVTPFHFDPEHNILLQLRGSKVMTQFPVNDEKMVPGEEHERYFSGGHRNLKWRDEFTQYGTEYPMQPGDALFVPVMAPHHVRVGPETSISLSITWRSEWSYGESDAYGFNAFARKVGLNPSRPSRFPQSNWAKAMSWRLLRRSGIGKLVLGNG